MNNNVCTRCGKPFKNHYKIQLRKDYTICGECNSYRRFVIDLKRRSKKYEKKSENIR